MIIKEKVKVIVMLCNLKEECDRVSNINLIDRENAINIGLRIKNLSNSNI